MTMSTISVDVDRAAEFLWRHARLLERRRFAHRFDRPDADGVAAAVLAYRNPDGGFGQVLEPDCRTPHSQPQATRLALGALADVGRLDPKVAEGAAAWAAVRLDRIATISVLPERVPERDLDEVLGWVPVPAERPSLLPDD
jgi:hypothetical protein